MVAVRRAIGMVFQKPHPFPTMSIFDNVAAGLRLTGTKGVVDVGEQTAFVVSGLFREFSDSSAPAVR